MLFTFVRMEFTSSLGPAPGRYPVAAIDPEDAVGDDALIVSLVGAPAPPERLLRRTRRESAPDGARAPREVSVLRVSWVHTSQPLDDRAARRNLADLRPEDRREALIAYVVTTVNRAIHAYSVAALDPFAAAISRWDPRSVHVGIGTGAQVDAGEWTEAFSCPAPAGGKAGTEERVRLDLAVSEALSGRAPTLDGETHLLRALLDVEQARARSAARELAGGADLVVEQRGQLDEADDEDLLGPRLDRAREVAAAPEPALADLGTAARELLEAITRIRGAATARRDAPVDDYA